MDEATTAAAFWATANAMNRAEAEDRPLPSDVPRMLHLVSDAGPRHLAEREKVTPNHVNAAEGAGAHQRGDELHIRRLVAQ